MDPNEAYLANLIYLNRVANTLSMEAKKVVRSVIDDVVADLARYDPTGVAARYQLSRMNLIMERVKQRSRTAFRELRDEMRERLGTLGVNQAQYQKDWIIETLRVSGAGTIAVDIGGINKSYFLQILRSEPFRGETLAGWFGQLGEKIPRDVQRHIRIGMAQNETIDQMVRRIRGRSIGGGRYAGGVMATTTHQAETIVRTAVNDIANTAHMAVYQQNDDITTGYEWVATLDAATCVECASLDGRTWKWDDAGLRQPPAHPRCRCATVPIIDWKGLGLEPPDEGGRASRTYGTDDKGKPVITGGRQVKAGTTYEQWLGRQPMSVKTRVLGSGRAKLFDEGKATLRELVRSDGTLIPLKDL